MSNTSNLPSMPFEADTTPAVDPITEAVHTLQQQHKLNREAHRAAFEQKAQQQWEAYEAKRKSDFIAQYHADNYIPLKYPYKGYSPAEQYRLSRTPDTRSAECAAQGLYDQVLYCLLARNGRKATIQQIQDWFRPWMPVTGDRSVTEDVGTGGARHVLTHASGLSKELGDLLTGTSMVDVEFGRVTWKDRDADLAEY